MQELSLYKEKQDLVKLCMSDLRKLAEEFQLKSTINQVSTYIDAIAMDRFNVVVVGNFSRGKSTFINALMGKKILPVSKKPTTAVISKISYSNNPRFTIHYKDYHSEDISEDEFYLITAPKEMNNDDPEDVRRKIEEQNGLDKISYAEIGYPLEFCNNGVDIVDTPGTNDMETIRVDITYKYLNTADAVIMILAAGQALTKSESSFLRERILENEIKDIFFVLNYKDQAKGEEEKVIEYLKENLVKILPDDMKENLKIHLVSSYQALLYRRKANGEDLSPKLQLKIPADFSITGFDELETDLAHFLSVDKGQRKLEGYVRKASAVIKEINHKINDRVEFSKHTADDVRKRLAILEPKFADSKQRANKIIVDMQLHLENYREEIKNYCAEATGEMYSEACRAVDEYEGLIKPNLIRDDINKAITSCQKQFINNMAKSMSAVVEQEYVKSVNEISQIWKELEYNYNRSCNLPAIVSSNVLNLDVEEEKDLTEDQVKWGVNSSAFAFGSLLAGGFLPALAFGAFGMWCLGLFDNKKEKIKSDIKHQLSVKMPDLSAKVKNNILNQYNSQVQSMCYSIQQTINGKIDDMEHQLKLVLQEKEQKEAEQHSQLEYLNSKKRELIAISEKLQGMIQ